MKKSEGKKEDDAIVLPLPGDKKEQPFATVVTDAQGRFSIPLRVIKPGRYTLRARFPGNEKYESSEATATITVLPNTSTKGTIKLENARSRASIRSSTNLETIKEAEEWSQTISRLAPDNLQKHALKEYEKTSQLAAKRIEQLRTLESSYNLSAGKQGFYIGKKIKKKLVG